MPTAQDGVWRENNKMLTQLLNKIKRLAFTPAKQQALLEDLYTLIQDGVPAVQAVQIVVESSVDITVDVAKNILFKVSEGRYLADGMVGWFPNHIVEIVRAGEEGGALAKTMQSAAESLSEKNTAVTSLFGSMTYPLIVMIMGSIVTVFINRSIFKTFSSIMPVSQWPLVGKDLIGVANFLQSWWWALLFALALPIFALVIILRNYVGDTRNLMDKLPGFAIYRRFIAGRFMQTLGLLIANGVVLKKALKILQHGANPYLSWHLITMEYRLGGGKDNIAEVLDTGLIDKEDLARLRIIAYGKGFEHALLRQGAHTLTQSSRRIKASGKVGGGLVLGVGAFFAIFIILGVYSVGSTVAGF